MIFHASNFGSFGASLPTDANGYVRCSKRKVEACKRALAAGRQPAAWADTGANVAVANAEIALENWRRE